MSLVTLEGHNHAARKRYWNLRKPPRGDAHCNGIACPKCGKELVDMQPDVQLTSAPPQKLVACLDCGWTGYRVDA